MTRDELLSTLTERRSEFDSRVAAIPRERFDSSSNGAHSPKQIVAHVTAYEELIVERLKAAHNGMTTQFDRDRVGWEAFNKRVWAEARQMALDEVLERSTRVFAGLVEEVGKLSDSELNEVAGVLKSIDEAWLAGRSLAELIAIDAYDHYPMHAEALEQAATELE